MSAEQLTRDLGGKWFGGYGSCKCPAHTDKNPSLMIRDGEKSILLRCFAGCESTAVIDALKARGLWPNRDDRMPYKRLQRPPQPRQDDDRAKRSEAARALWNRAQPAPGTPVETYLASRGITSDIPPSIRYLAGAKHAATGLYLPCMIAAVTRWPSRDVVAVHRTFLRADGKGKAAVSRAKMMLGPVGGGAVRFGPHGSTLVVGEGIESAMSVYQETGIPTWAALSKGGIEKLILPPDVTEIIIAADHDEPGLAAAKKAAQRWQAEGRKVRIAVPPVEKWDFNDVLTAKNVAAFRRRAAHG